ncbi:dTDP-4-dehydrorhamnose reductase [Sneathiella limimaris]|uniref:dTDP-4-dehydrorhamnose reductase n=1 Tax=Sneathiella limimaris TaxID=1964213 RepID=UPI00146D50D6|nr:dTDP-4-dehydrorhamnose reductase [Sneathiella limimaris]
MKVFITGTRGQVGSELNLQGQALGHEVVALDHSSLDITDKYQVINLVRSTGPDVVINAAAYTVVDKAESNVQQAMKVNRDAPQFLAEACHLVGIPLVHISTDFVFDGHKSGAYLETDPCDPLSVYGRSKFEGEQLIQNTLKEHIILRTAWVFGGEANFVNTMRRLGREREEISVVNDQFGGPTAASDIAGTLLKIAEAIKEPSFQDWGVYHYCGSPAVSWYEFAVEILKDNPAVTVKPIPTSDYPTPAKRPANSVLDCSKIEQVFHIIQPNWREKL